MAFFEISRQARRRVGIASELPATHPAVLDQLDTLLASLPDPELLCAEERAGSMTAAVMLRNRLDAFLTGLAGAADRNSDARLLHAGTTGTLVAAATGQNPQTGSATVTRARELAELPAVAAAYASGTISTAHVAAITADAARIDNFTAIEAGVVATAAVVEPAELRRILTVLVDQSRPERLDEKHEALCVKRGLSLSETGNGMFRIDGYFDPITGNELRNTLTALMKRTGPNDTRTPKQRRADAMADLLHAAAANTRPLGGSALSILIDLDQLTDARGATLDDNTPLGPQLFDLLTCTPQLNLLLGVKRKKIFVPLALGRSTRRATAGQWKALVARDRGCIRCGRAARHCEAHHIHHWRHGGKTDLKNLVLLCNRCHHDLHFGHYTITVDHGVPTITPTTGRAPPRP